MGVIILTMDDEVSQLNPMAVKMLGVRMEEAMAKRLDQMDSPLAAELSSIPKDETAVVRLNDANIYKCTHSSFIDRGFKHPFFLIERMTEEVMRAEKRAYEKVIRMIAHEVNNTTAGITSTLDTVEQALSTEDDMEDICDDDARLYGALFLDEPFHYPFCRCGKDTRTYPGTRPTE